MVRVGVRVKIRDRAMCGPLMRVFLSSERSSSRRRRRELCEGERGEPGCHRKRQTGSPSELRYEIQLVNCQAGVPQHGMGGARSIR